MKVSVYCLAYNHEKYIRDALNGFVSQVVDFDYEVFVHDDASTDNTASIIAEYANMYPDIIKPIYQKENQFSRGVAISKTFIYPRLSGKYIAICEGDDYWTDQYKLKKQVEYLETHEDCSACVHNTLVQNCKTKKSSLMNKRTNDEDISIDEILERGNGQFQMSSLVYRRKYLYRPSSFEVKGFGDYPLAIYLSLNGRVHYLKDVMSVYRLYSDGSWTSRNYLSQNRKNNLIQINRANIALLKSVDLYTNLLYHTKITEVIRTREFEIEGAKGNYKKQMEEYKDVFRKLTLSDKCKVALKRCFLTPMSAKEEECNRN